ESHRQKLSFLLYFQSGGGGRTRTYEGVSQRIYSPPPLPLGTLPRTSHPGGCEGRAGLWGARRAVSTAPHPPAPAPKNATDVLILAPPHGTLAAKDLPCANALRIRPPGSGPIAAAGRAGPRAAARHRAARRACPATAR